MWTVVLADETYKQVGEIDSLREFVYMGALSKLASVTFKVRLDHARVDALAAATGYIKAYRRGVLRYVGPIVTTQEVANAEQQTLTVTSADAGWYLQKRLAGKSANGTIFDPAQNVASIAKTLVDTTNAENETGIRTGTVPVSAGSARTFKAGPYRPVLECVNALGSPLDGFDWRFQPIENYAAGAVTGTKIADFVAQDVVGVPRPKAVFEYGVGTRSNVYEYSLSRSRDGQANRLYHIGQDASTALVRSDAASISLYKLLEEVLSAEITDPDMVGGLLNEHIALRRNPRDLVGVTPHIGDGTLRVPEPFVDYDFGDTVSFKAKFGGKTRFQGGVRVYGIQATMDEKGFERIELTVEDQG